MRTTYVGSIKVDYQIDFNNMQVKLFVSKRVGQKILATFDGKPIEVTYDDVKGSYSVFIFWVSTTKYYSFGSAIRDIVNNRFSFEKIVDLSSRRASYELLRALS